MGDAPGYYEKSGVNLAVVGVRVLGKEPGAEFCQPWCLVSCV